MSWGERSCIYIEKGSDSRPCDPSFGTCNTRCKHYKSNGKPPDTIQVSSGNNNATAPAFDGTMRLPATGPLVQKILAPLKKAIQKDQPPRRVPMNRAERRSAKRNKA